MKKRDASRGGFVLYVVLGAIVVVSMVTFGVLNYSMFALRSTASFTRTSECRLAAAAVLEDAKIGINSAFINYQRGNRNQWNMLDWFNNFTETSVGTGSFFYVLPTGTNVNGFTVSVRIVSVDQRMLANAIECSTLRIQSVAVGASTLGNPIRKTLEEEVEFRLRRSPVFDYAYFVNNYGWFYGNGCTANGDVRANGDFCIDVNSYINGSVMAAPNEENGATGTIEVDGGDFPNFRTIPEYWSSASDRARPTNPPGHNPSVEYAMGYEGETHLYPYQPPLEMPFLGDLQVYKNLAIGLGGTISRGGVKLIDGVFTNTGPSQVANAADKGCIVLIGEKNNPLVINGPVVVEKDVIISGYVTGQGTIYAGRNVHIIGNITYVHPPSWNKPDEHSDASVAANAGKDLLGLVAKGNIVFGDYTNPTWLSNVGPYIKPSFVKPYSCDPTDASIGYPAKFNGDYTAKDGLMKVDAVTKVKTYDKNGKVVFVPAATKEPSRYYESLVADTEIKRDNSYTITQIDAVLYNNHATMGKVGNCDLNGSIVCRDDGIIYNAALRLNWDIRLGTRSRDGMNLWIFLPVVVGDPSVVGWKEVYP